jgi:hypothetical protein
MQKILVWKANGVWDRKLIERMDIYLARITETYLNSGNRFCIWKDPCNMGGGGEAILKKKDIIHTFMKYRELQRIELAGIHTKLENFIYL